MQRLLVILLALLPCFTYAQKTGRALADSLLVELVGQGDDTNKVLILDRLSYLYVNIDPDSGIFFAEKALNLAKQLEWDRGIAVAYSDLATNYRAQSNHHLALKHSSIALEIYEKTGNKRSIAAVLSNTALTYQALGKYPEALDNYFKALKAMEELGDSASEAMIRENIGTLYKMQKNYSRALEYYTSALAINKELNNVPGLARNLGNMGIVYDAQGEYLKALKNHRDALEINKREGNKFGMQINLANIGIVHLHMGEPEKAIDFHKQALAISEELGAKNNTAINLGNIGATYYTLATENKGNSQANLANAIKYLEQAVNICTETGFLAPATEFIPSLTDACAQAGNYKKAYEYQKLFSSIIDSLFSVESKMQIANLENQREIELKQRDLELKDKQIQIAQLELEKRRSLQGLYAMGLALLLMILAITIKSIIAYRKSNKLLSKAQVLQQDIILNQNLEIMARNKVLEEIAHKHSHDIRGQIATIMGLSQMFNKTDYADPGNKTIIEGIESSAESLDKVVREIVKNENNLKKGKQGSEQ